MQGKSPAVRTGYAPVNGLEMYYELHGAYMTIEAMGAIIPRLAESRQVIAVELQGHGRTADIAGRPLRYEALAMFTNAFLAAAAASSSGH